MKYTPMPFLLCLSATSASSLTGSTTEYPLPFNKTDGEQGCNADDSAVRIASAYPLSLNQTDGNHGCIADDSATSLASASPAEAIPFPKMPEKIRALLHENWDVLDPRGAEMISTLSAIDGAVEFAHASTTFYEHLKGTFGILSAWDQPEAVRRAGLMHTAYGGDLFQFFLFDSNHEEERDQVRDIMGVDAEALTYLFGTVDRGSLCSFKDVVNRESETRDAFCPPGNQTVAHRTSSFIDIEARDAANVLMVTIADYLDQMVDINLWRDHHQVDDGGLNLYPGSGRPALGFYWFSSVCNAIRDYLEVVPAVFNHCQDVLYIEEEEEARDLYWDVTINEGNLSEDEQIDRLDRSVHLNGFIAEPHVLLSQIYFRQGRYQDAALEANAALTKFYALASNWDKRRSFNHWVGFARALLLRSNRMIEGNRKECSFPCHDPSNPLYDNHQNLKLINLHNAVKEMNEREE